MKESSLNRICLIGAVAGIIILYVSSFFFTQEEVNIGDIDEVMVGIKVNVTGRTDDVYFHRDGHVFFTLYDSTGNIRVVVWKDVAKQLELSGKKRIRDNITLNLYGEIDRYKGELELIPSAKGISFI